VVDLVGDEPGDAALEDGDPSTSVRELGGVMTGRHDRLLTVARAA
jgi:hypothetical protein